VVLLYDRTFIAGTFRAGWQARQRYYFGLFATWFVLAWLVIGTSGRGGSVGSEMISSWTYALTQSWAVLHYLRLVVWPSPLVFDYGTSVVRSIGEVGWQLAFVSLMVAGVVVLLRRASVTGFLGASFFLLLAPSSSVIPIATQTVSEHRMYLALAPVLVLVGLALQRSLGPRAGIGLAVLAMIAGGLTIRRNADYHSEFSLWQDTVDKRPDNARAQGAHGKNLFLQGKYAEALAALQEAVRLAPSEDPDHHFNAGLTLERLNRPAEALAYYQAAARLRPGDPETWNQIGMCFVSLDRHAEAVEAFQQSLKFNAQQGGLYFRLGESFFAQRNFADAAASYRDAIRRSPADAALHHYCGLALALSGRTAEAIAEFEQALRLRPDYLEASQALARARAELSRAGPR
jgi:tetratricopeptide (TPR) repeat protein